MVRWLAVFLLGCASPAARPLAVRPADPTAPVPLAIGETFHLASRVLGETRVINVYLPPGYATSGARYPVLYMPDGGIAEDFPQIAGLVDVSVKDFVIPPMIVVGIENTERRRDLVGPTAVPKERAVAPHAGGSDRFRQFLREELKPHITAHYRTSDKTALIGESLAGLFVLETLLVEPDLFDAYIAADPSVWWNKQALVRGAAARFAAWTAKPVAVFVATADPPETAEGVAILLTAKDDHAPKGLAITYVAMPEERHNTIFPLAALRGLRALFGLPPL